MSTPSPGIRRLELVVGLIVVAIGAVVGGLYFRGAGWAVAGAAIAFVGVVLVQLGLTRRRRRS